MAATYSISHKNQPIYLAQYSVTMPDKSIWRVPVRVIAINRAQHYADEFGGCIERSLNDDTLPLFAGSHFEIKDWASNNMNWSDVAVHAHCVGSDAIDYQEGWVNGQHQVVLCEKRKAAPKHLTENRACRRLEQWADAGCPDDVHQIAGGVALLQGQVNWLTARLAEAEIE